MNVLRLADSSLCGRNHYFPRRAGTLKNPDFFWGTDLEEAARKLSQNTGSELWDRATFPPEDRHRIEGSHMSRCSGTDGGHVCFDHHLLVGGFKPCFSPQYMG